MNRSTKTRRSFLKETSLAGVVAFTLPSFNILRSPDLDKDIIGHGKFKYRIHRTWGDLDPSKIPIKNCHEMMMDAKGRLVMITDSLENNVIIYNKDGKLVDSWTLKKGGRHGLTLFNEGEEDVLFLSYCAGERPEVVKADLKGNVLMSLPDPREIGVYEKDMKFRPTETAIAPNGDIYVADGYGSCFILQFNKDGEFIHKFGGRGRGDDSLDTAHGVAIDDRDPNNLRLICTSRGQNCFKWFSLEGKLLSTLYLPGAYVCRPVIDDENLYAGVCWSMLRYSERTANSGFVTILNEDNKVVSNPGGTKPFYHKGELQMMTQVKPYFKHCHDVCVDDDKNLYICQWNANKTYPIKLERV